MRLTHVKATEAGYAVFNNCKDISRIRDMHGHCLIVSDEYLMRGVDYRLKEVILDDTTDGIDLLIACPFSNGRAYK